MAGRSTATVECFTTRWSEVVAGQGLGGRKKLEIGDKVRHRFLAEVDTPRAAQIPLSPT